MSRLGRGFPNNALMRIPLVIPVAYDATGAGSTASSTAWSWNHVIGGNAVVALVNTYTASSSPTVTAKVGTTSMSLIGNVVAYYNDGSGYCSVYLFGLLQPPTGSQTVTVNSSVSSATAANSVSYRNVAGFGGPVTNSGTSGTASVSAPAGRMGQITVGGFSGYASSFSGFSQTSRYNVPHVTSVNISMVLGDASNATASLSASVSSSNWGGVEVPLLP